MRRHTVGAAALSLVPIGLLLWSFPGWWWASLIFGSLATIALCDIRQTRHSIRRNFPVVGHFRYLFESIRPEINQYFIESHTDGTPFNREIRSLVYQRSKSQRDTVPFGTRHDVYAPGYECVRHSLSPVRVNPEELRVVVGNSQCSQPYDASIYNISAMSFGALSSRAIEALNRGARQGRFAHNSGEGGLSLYHLQHGGDLIWQIGTGYFGCRDASGRFDPAAFSKLARRPQVKMIELKLSQGAKPSLGGLLPASKVTAEIAATRGVPMGRSVASPARHSAFDDFDGLCDFLGFLRQLSGGKPIGFKLCLGYAEEFDAVCRAIVRSGIIPDFVAVDGAEGGTGAAPLEFSNHVGLPLFEALTIVHKSLVLYELRGQVRVICSGKIATGFDIIRALALGADLCYSARGMMLALGCIQALRCDSNKCPTGVATQNPRLVDGLVVDEKATRVASFHRKTIEATAELLGAMGLRRTSEVTAHHVLRRTQDGPMASLAQIYDLGDDSVHSRLVTIPRRRDVAQCSGSQKGNEDEEKNRDDHFCRLPSTVSPVG